MSGLLSSVYYGLRKVISYAAPPRCGTDGMYATGTSSEPATATIEQDVTIFPDSDKVAISSTVVSLENLNISYIYGNIIDPILTLNQVSRECTYVANSGAIKPGRPGDNVVFNEEDLTYGLAFTSATAKGIAPQSVPYENCNTPGSENCPYPGGVTETPWNGGTVEDSYPRGVTATVTLKYNCSSQNINSPAPGTAEYFRISVTDNFGNTATEATFASGTDTINLSENGLATKDGVSMTLLRAFYNWRDYGGGVAKTIRILFPSYLDEVK